MADMLFVLLSHPLSASIYTLDEHCKQLKIKERVEVKERLNPELRFALRCLYVLRCVALLICFAFPPPLIHISNPNYIYVLTVHFNWLFLTFSAWCVYGSLEYIKLGMEPFSLIL